MSTNDPEYPTPPVISVKKKKEMRHEPTEQDLIV